MSSSELRRLRADLDAGRTTPAALEAESQRRADEWSDLGAFVDRTGVIASGEAPEGGLLAGIPIAIKDNICTVDAPTRCGSQILGDFISGFDAEAARRLRAQGATLFGKTNMDEFAMGSSGENSSFQVTRNPWGFDRAPGGSSSGSAAAVAAGIVPAALGSDTGGSIRQPAAFCGIVGMKPTYGRVSRRGLVAYGSSLDQVGPFARTVEDAAILYEAIAGFDPGDSTSAERDVASVLEGLEGGVRGLRVGVPAEFFAEGLDPEVRASVMGVARSLEAAGATLVDVALPHTKFGVAAYYILATAEASSNLSRFDGVRYGHRTESPTDIDDLYARSRSEGFGIEVIRRILLGTFVLCSGFYDAYYGKAQRVRALVCRDYVDAFATCDVLLTPTTPAPAFGLGGKTSDPLQMYLADVYTVSANLAGIPGISVPSGQTSEGLPIGVQFLAPAFDEATLFRVARAWEQARGAFPMPSREAFVSRADVPGADA